MEEKGISASDLSRASGVGKNLISYYIHGRCLAKQDKVFLLAKALDVDPGWLMTGYEPDTKELFDTIEKELEEVPVTVEARVLAKGMDKMPEAQRKAILQMMTGLYPGLFEKGNEEDDT